MGISANQLMQSQYFLPVFNMAIFDGPFRLYFPQELEEEALRMYVELNEVLAGRVQPSWLGRWHSKSLIVLLYPDHETFSKAFENPSTIAETIFMDAKIVGIAGPVCESQALTLITRRIEDLYHALSPEPEAITLEFSEV